jgi:hypothetical protein
VSRGKNSAAFVKLKARACVLVAEDKRRERSAFALHYQEKALFRLRRRKS